jgi:hypothetical protein
LFQNCLRFISIVRRNIEHSQASARIENSKISLPILLKTTINHELIFKRSSKELSGFSGANTNEWELCWIRSNSKKKKRKIGKIENKCGDEEKGKQEESLARKESKNKNKLLLFRSANNS